MSTADIPPFPETGAHQPHWLWRAGFPLFASHRQLARRRSLRPASCRWALDSGGFTELSLHGRWVTGAEDYAAAVARYAGKIGGPDPAAPQDWMCEPHIVARTGLSVREHQDRTVASYLQLRRLAPGLPFIPVLQGWHLADYLRCVRRYAAAGVDLTAVPLTGLGSVCRRQSTGEIAAVVAALARLGIRLHGHLLASADSMAWSYAARRLPALPGSPATGTARTAWPTPPAGGPGSCPATARGPCSTTRRPGRDGDLAG